MSGRRKNVAIESFLVVILMIVFSIAVAILIVQGASTFKTTIDYRQQEENLRIGMSYMNMMIRQNDNQGAITFPKPPNGVEILVQINHTPENSSMKTYIYFQDGILYECYTDGPLDPAVATPIVALSGITLFYDASNAVLTLHYPHVIDKTPTTLEQVIALRTREVLP